MSPQLQGSNFGGVPVLPSATQPSQVRHTGGVIAKAQSAEPPAVWKPPPPHGSITGAVFFQVYTYEANPDKCHVKHMALVTKGRYYASCVNIILLRSGEGTLWVT